MNDLAERIERELNALGLTHPIAREHAAVGLCRKYAWLAAQEERAARAATPGDTC